MRPTSGPTDTDEKLLHRVRSLLAKAESTTFVDEAAALTTKAHQLMAAHALDRALLGEAPDGARVASSRVVLPAPYAKDKFALLSAVASANRCRAILGVDRVDQDALGVLASGDRLATVVGHGDDLEVVDTLFTSLLLQAVHLMLDHGSVIDAWGDNRTRSFRHSFLTAFAWTIGERLRASQEHATARADQSAHGRLLPVLADRQTRVEQAVRAAFPRLGTMATSVSNADGLVAGRRAGQRVDIGTTRFGSGARPLHR